MILPNLVPVYLFKFISQYFPNYEFPFASCTVFVDQEQVKSQQEPEGGIRLGQWTLEIEGWRRQQTAAASVRGYVASESMNDKWESE